ncbi:MAG: hypothetical protein C0410_03620 [Anaerolinea sp.]|nr:hypothetical protein [Anaerolinea sp.]
MKSKPSSSGSRKNYYLMNTAGSNQTRVINDQGMDVQPSYLLNGNKIVFKFDHDGSLEIHVIHVDGNDHTRLMDNQIGNNGAAWSPYVQKGCF